MTGGRSGTLVSINRSNGGVPKTATSAARVTTLGIEGDHHEDRNHGGPERAICLYSVELIEALRGEGHPIDVGTAGENFTVRDLDWNLVTPGARLTVGRTVTLEVTSFTNPCKTIAASFRAGKFSRISPKPHPSWSRVYARVLEEGEVALGDPVSVLG